MDEGGKDCAWVHAYLHRVEGDLPRTRAIGTGRPASPSRQTALPAEWDAIARALLANAQC